MNRTLFSHVYNEEYLLPFWLEHHKRLFDNAIIVDYASTDNTVSIIKDICPNWTVLQSRNSDFMARQVDIEITELEQTVEGYKMCLNATEFLLPNGSLNELLPDRNRLAIQIQVLELVDKEQTEIRDLFDFISGFKYTSSSLGPSHRYMHNIVSSDEYYDVGRHNLRSERVGTREPLKVIDETIGLPIYIAKTAYYPWNDRLHARKKQIGPRIPAADKACGAGFQHYKHNYQNLYNEYKAHAVSLQEHAAFWACVMYNLPDKGATNEEV